jgi:hypothetical protein
MLFRQFPNKILPPPTVGQPRRHQIGIRTDDFEAADLGSHHSDLHQKAPHTPFGNLPD